jgi:plasmid maintenance system antidote protein VapI
VFPMTVAQFAKHIGIARGTLSRIINARRHHPGCFDPA